MNILNQFFNKIYVITSYPTQNRLNDLVFFFNNECIQYELIVAPKKKYFGDYNDEKLWLGKGNFSLLSANESIFLKESFVKSNTFCVLEDDVFFDLKYKEKLNMFFEYLPNTWNILNLGYHKNTFLNKKIDNNSQLYLKLTNNEEIVGTHFMSYKKDVVPFILEKLDSNGYPMDWFLTKTIYSNFNTYTCTDKIFYARSFRETENDKFEFYKKYKSEISL